MFRQVFKGRQGNTVISDNPKLDAYKQAAWVARSGSTYSMMAHLDGSYTVNGNGGMMTFAPEGSQNAIPAA